MSSVRFITDSNIMFVCNKCSDCFNNRKDFLKHVRFLHKNQSDFKCGQSICLRVFSSINSLEKHLKLKHAPNFATRSPSKTTEKTSTDEDRTVQVENTADSFLQSAPNTSDGGQNYCHAEVEQEIFPIHKLPSCTKKSYTLYEIFTAELLQYPDIPRTRAINIINSTNKLIRHTLNTVKEEVLANIETPATYNSIEKIFQNHFSTFTAPETEWNLFDKYKSFGTFIKPEEYLLGEISEFTKKNNKRTLKIKEVYGQFIPMRTVLKKFFELPGVYDSTVDYLETLRNPEIIANFVQSHVWKASTADFKEKLVLPLHLFFDDYESNNPLGSHKGIAKCGAVYLAIPCLPPHMVSKLEFFFLFALSNTLDRKQFSKAIVLSKLIDELKYLEIHGVEINSNGQEVKIFFKLGLVIGDNLGVHEMLGFSESFNTLHFCRFCKIKK